MSLNKVLLIGHLGQDPEKRVTSGGSSVVTLNLATTEKWVKDGQKNEHTEWHKVVLWNQLADLAEKYLKKGSQIYIEGSNQTREWKDKDGNKRYVTEVKAREMKFLGGGSGSGSSGQNYQTPPSTPPFSNNPPQGDFIEEDVPF